MRATLLTDVAIRALDPARGRIDVFDTEARGLAIRVNATSKTWVLFYRNRQGKQRRLTLGQYPETSLAKARKRARDERDRISDGADPAAEKREAREAGDKSFGALAEKYLAYAEKTKRSWKEDRRILHADVLPAWKARGADELARRDVRALVEPIAERAPVMANRVWALISRIFNYGIEHDWLETNPATQIPKQQETSRDRVLSSEEIKTLWADLEDAKRIRPADETEPEADEDKGGPIPPMIARGLQVLLLTAQRPGEVFRMRWADLDLPADWETNTKARGWWTIPIPMSKNKNPHRVPIGPAVLAVLREARACGPDPGRNPYVFAGIKGGSVADRAVRAGVVLSKRLGFEFHRHDLRRTAASGMAEAGIPRETIAKVLNHVDRGARMTAVYDRYRYDAEKQTALDTWTRRLAGILKAKQPAAVVPFKGRA